MNDKKVELDIYLDEITNHIYLRVLSEKETLLDLTKMLGQTLALYIFAEVEGDEEKLWKFYRELAPQMYDVYYEQ